MDVNYKKVPEILTGKDMNYLSDMFEWNKMAFKLTDEGINNSEIKEVTSLLKEINDTFYNNLNTILDTINEMGECDE